MIDGKSILVTGGTGHFGQQFVEYLLNNYSPSRVIVYSRDEHKQYIMHERLKDRYDDKLRFFIGNIRDKSRLQRALNGVDYVVHAAALKHISTCEYNPIEAIKTNIMGAINVIDASIDAGVEKVVALSTDKAVNPISLYGGTKLVSDKLFVLGNSYSGNNGSRFSIVRFGNVADSRGAVIPLFRRLIENGATELPVTDFRMTRFWTEVDQGIDLVIRALENSYGGEIYVPKCPSFRITDLAEAMLPGGNKTEIGMDDCEKISEILITKEEAKKTFEYDDCYIIYPYSFGWNESMMMPHGRKVDHDFEYTSATNENWIGSGDIVRLLSGRKNSLGY